MKRILLFFTFLISLFSSSFAYNWFDERYVELSFVSKFGISNNAVDINKILSKHVEIDLKKMADSIPSTGWTMNSNFVPELALNLRFKKFQLGFTTGSDVWAEGSLSKDLFNYLGNGNTLYQTVSISQTINVDAFAYEEIMFGFNVKAFKIIVKPTFFLPICHIGSSRGTLNLVNLSDGSLNVDYSSDIEIFSAFAIEGGGSFSPGIGFDIAGSVSYPLFDFLLLTGNVRLPIFPGRLSYKTVQNTTFKFSTTVDKIINGSLGSDNFDSTHGDSTSTSYYINRPMKFSAYADFTPIGEWIIFTGGLGCGFRHPFTSDSDSFDFYGEYYLAGTLRFQKILKFIFSTEYYEKVFIHQFIFSANARIVEIVLGINAQSTDFTKSCSGGGVGGLFAIKLGY